MKKRFKAKIYEASEAQLKGANISCNIIDDVKPPIWFVEFEKRNNARWDRQEEFNTKVNVFMNEQTKFNQQQIKFNKMVITRLDGIDQRLDKLDDRIDNLVVKNNLRE